MQIQPKSARTQSQKPKDKQRTEIGAFVLSIASKKCVNFVFIVL